MRPFSIWQSSCPEPTALAITPQGAGCQAKDRRGQAVVLWRFDFVMLKIVPLRPKPPCGRGRNFIHPQTYFSDLRSASKASFETPGEYASLPFVRRRRRAPHPPPKPGNSNDDKLFEIYRFRSPALVGRIDSTSRAQRQNTKAGSGENIEYIA